MNTLAVNRLLRKLEAAIASGHHQQAAGLAKELAQLKIHCSVIRQRTCKAKERLNLNLFIEDKQAHQGPIPLQV
jgi:RanBP-type and C3HC4-type zinc finger-containing protein 1